MIQNLLASLLGQTPNPENNYGDGGGYAGYGGLPVPGLTPGGAISEAGATPGASQLPVPAMDQEEAITVKGWKPSKRKFLEVLGDAVLLHGGYAPMFAKNRQMKNMREAMEGFTSDPMSAIGRIAQVDQKMAWDLLNQQQDNSRAETVAREQQARNLERVRDRIAAMAGAATPENYDRVLPIMRRYAESRGLDPSEIPETYDPVALGTYRMGSVSVDHQMDNERDAYAKEELVEYRGKRLDQFERKINNDEAYRAERLKDADERLAASERRTAANKGSVQTLNTKHGPAQFSPDRKRMILNGNRYELSEDGKQYIRIK
jgi:hypothetical protein